MAENKKIILKITGMSCNGCAMSVTRALKKVTGVINAEVHLPSATAIVETADNGPSVNDLTTAVKKAGYQAERA